MAIAEHQAKFEVLKFVIIHYDLDAKEGETRPVASKIPELLTTTLQAERLSKSVYRILTDEGEEPQLRASNVWKELASATKGLLRANDRIYMHYPAQGATASISAVLTGNENSLVHDPFLQHLGSVWNGPSK